MNFGVFFNNLCFLVLLHAHQNKCLLQKRSYRRLALSYLSPEVDMIQGGRSSLISNQRQTPGGRASGVLTHGLADLLGSCAGDSSNKQRLEVYDPSPPFLPCPQSSESILRKYCPCTFS